MPDRDDAEDDDGSVSAFEEGDEAADEDQMDEDEVAEQILDVEGVPATPTRQSNKAKSAKASATKTPKVKGTAKTAKTPGTVKKKKPRKSEQLNLNALSQEQLMVAEMEGSKMQQLKLQRKYYADALELIRWLDNAAPVLCSLLASTSKTEVLEAMEYFRVAWEYRLETGAVRYSGSSFSYYQTNLVFFRLESRR
jgi:condensin complex subunit 1